MGIGTLRIQDLEYGQSHLTDGARRPRRLYPAAIITANGAQTKAELKRCIVRRDRHAFTVELDVEPIVEAGVAYDVACGNEILQAEARRTMRWATHDAFGDDDWSEPGFADFDKSDAELHAEAVRARQAYEDDGIAFDVPTSSVYGDTVELWDADEWTQLGFSITTPR